MMKSVTLALALFAGVASAQQQVTGTIVNGQFIPNGQTTTNLIQQTYVQPPQPVPQFPQPAKPTRMTGKCMLYDQNAPSTPAVEGSIVYAVSVREIPFCLVLNEPNCRYSGGVPTYATGVSWGTGTISNADATKQLATDAGNTDFWNTQYAMCLKWRVAEAKKTGDANTIAITKARCALLDSQSTDIFITTDVAACKAAGFAVVVPDAALGANPARA